MSDSLENLRTDLTSKKEKIIEELKSLSNEEKNIIFQEFIKQEKDLEKEENLAYLLEKPNMSEEDKKNMKLSIKRIIDLKKISDRDKCDYEKQEENEKRGCSIIRPINRNYKNNWIGNDDYMTYIKQLENINYTESYIEMGGIKFSKNIFRGVKERHLFGFSKKNIIINKNESYFSSKEIQNQKKYLEKKGMVLLTRDNFELLLTKIPSYKEKRLWQVGDRSISNYTILPFILGLPKSGYFSDDHIIDNHIIHSGTKSYSWIDNNNDDLLIIRFDECGEYKIYSKTDFGSGSYLLPCRPIYK